MSATAQGYVPKLARSAQTAMTQGVRRILVIGAGGVGKTTLSVSASRFAGDTIPAKERTECKDVVVFQGDSEGIAGAYHAGFVPGYVYDLSHCTKWEQFDRDLCAALADIRPLCGKPEGVKYAVVDLGIAQRLITAEVKPSVQKDWNQVSALGEKLFHAFSGLPGMTIIGNAHIKSSQGVTETGQAIDSSNARAVGGERAKFTMDLNKGVGQIWRDNSSLIVTREMKRKKGQGDAVDISHYSHTQAGLRFEAKSRFCGILQPTEPGERTLRSMLAQAYGDAL